MDIDMCGQLDFGLNNSFTVKSDHTCKNTKSF